MEALYIAIVALWILGYGGHFLYSMDNEGDKPMIRIIILCLGTVILYFIGVYFFPQLFSDF